jgi:DNA ligase 1
MKAFSTLLDHLSYAPGRNSKISLLAEYFQTTPDPDRGYALAALNDKLALGLQGRKLLLELSQLHISEDLYRLSRDYVGDSAETLSLIWPDRSSAEAPRLAHVIAQIKQQPKNEMFQLIAHWLDNLDVNGRWALLKLLTGAMRTGVSGRLSKLALAQAFDKDVEQIEQIWHGLKPPYIEFFAWLENRADVPDVKDAVIFRPVMLSHPLEDRDLERLDPSQYQIEWKWDGIRVQISSGTAGTKLFSRTGDDISRSFPEFKDIKFNATLDGELLVGRHGVVAPFQDLQQRLNRKTVSKQSIDDYPAFIRLYDALYIEGEDLRALKLSERRLRLDGWFLAKNPSNVDLSEVLEVSDLDKLREIWTFTRHEGIEGLMLKRRDSAYISGRPKGLWWKWKREPLIADCVLIYTQRGSGKRSSFFSDFTFAAWNDAVSPRQLVPVGKAYSGFSDEELKKLDHFVRNNTTNKFGPVRQLQAKLVFEIAFDAIQISNRHKSGVAMRFPRISRVRWDKPASEADTLEHLSNLIDRIPK